MQYQTLRSVSDHHVFVVCRDGTFYEIVPEDVRKQGPWQGQYRGEVERLKPEYRLALARDGYALVKCEHVTHVSLDAIRQPADQSLPDRSGPGAGRRTNRIFVRGSVGPQGNSLGRGWPGPGIPVSSAIANEVRGARPS